MIALTLHLGRFVLRLRVGIEPALPTRALPVRLRAAEDNRVAQAPSELLVVGGETGLQ